MKASRHVLTRLWDMIRPQYISSARVPVDPEVGPVATGADPAISLGHEAPIWEEGQGARRLVGYRRRETDGRVAVHWLVDPDRLTGIIRPEPFAEEGKEPGGR